MMGEANPQPAFFYNISLETFVAADHPLRAIRPLIDDRAIRRACRDLYSPIGRPSIPPEQLFLALVGGYLLGVTSDRKLVMELQCNMALRWFVGLNLDQQPWDASTFSQNRRRRFDESGVLERLFDETVKRAMAEGLVSRHVSADGTLVRANASYKSFLPIEVALDPEEYKRRLRKHDRTDDGPHDPGNRAVNFRSEKRSNATHRSATDSDCRFVSRRLSPVSAVPQADRRAVRGRQGLARLTTLPAARPPPRATGGLPDRLGTQSQAAREGQRAGAAARMRHAPMAQRGGPQRRTKLAYRERSR